jgi:uncharacterized membrane protein YGL010W
MSYLEQYRTLHRNPTNRRLHSIGIPMILFSLILIAWSWQAAVALFIVGWILQFIGHHYEGKRPAFYSNLIFFAIGPYWWVRKIVGLEKE